MRLAALLLVLLGACAAAREGVVFTKPTALPAPGAPPVIVGNWQVDDDSRTIMEISDGGGVKVRAYSPDDRVDFSVSDVSWDGKRLKATFTYPPTGFVTKSDLELVDENTLEGPVDGGYQGYEIWKRLKR